ncbi:MAG: Gfo/Idh/MocA family oxidoreductase [Clostridia bacterium]
MEHVRIGIIGFGSMASSHARYLAAGEIPGASVTAAHDTNEKRFQTLEKDFNGAIRGFTDIQEFFSSGLFDAVLVATPHYHHPEYVMMSLDKGFHVLCEKPAGVYTAHVREMNRHAANSGKIFAIMFNQRVNPVYIKLKDLISSGELGDLKRCIWIITNWYRPQSYYDSGSWRATWSGEGGGVLLNQDPHQLDLWQWILGMPERVRAFCYFGKYHDIEVEDDVTAYMEYTNGMTGLFVTSTGETPGTNRLEISGDRGKLVIEDDVIKFSRLRTPERTFNREFKGGFGQPECWESVIPVEGANPQHKGITRNFVQAILKGEKLIAPGTEGIHSLTLSNAMLLSSWTDAWVDLPIDEDLFLSILKEKVRTSTKRKSASNAILDTTGTY